MILNYSWIYKGFPGNPLKKLRIRASVKNKPDWTRIRSKSYGFTLDKQQANGFWVPPSPSNPVNVVLKCARGPWGNFSIWAGFCNNRDEDNFLKKYLLPLVGSGCYRFRCFHMGNQALRKCIRGVAYLYKLGKWLANRNVLGYVQLVYGFLWWMLLEGEKS